MPLEIARRIAGFLIRCGLVYGLFLLLWLGIAEGYGKAYARSAQALLGSADPTRGARIAWMPAAGRSGVEHWGRDIVVDLQLVGGLRQATILKESFSRSSRYTGYVPTALLIALILATPVSRRRKALALALGLVLIHAFAVLMLAVMIWEWFYQAENQMLFRMYPDLYPTWKQYLHSLWEISTWMMPYFAAPTAIWLLVTLRPGDLAQLAGVGPEPPRG